ncbi:hypothetical protein ACQR1Y_13645 [Bradyrhizobium sp. HKCCYLRH3099]|uniref:hypothetical protein n=1 Tax=unclassified Bradyrhizobium TaxID=2631580 RepID=UPI003EBD4AE2
MQIASFPPRSDRGECRVNFRDLAHLERAARRGHSAADEATEAAAARGAAGRAFGKTMTASGEELLGGVAQDVIKAAMDPGVQVGWAG